MTFEEYVTVHGSGLVQFARLLTGDAHRAEDLVQDVLARAYVRWKRISKADVPDHYVRRMLINANNTWWRRRSSHELRVATVADRPVGGDLGAAAVERDVLWRLVMALPPKQRAVLVLRYYCDLDDPAIAQIVGCSAVTVRTHALRAVARLRERYPAVDDVPSTGGRS